MHDGGGAARVLELRNLRVLSALGRGAKGVVFLVDDGGELLALKAILRSSIEKKKTNMNAKGDEYRRVCFERQVLSSFDHPLLPKLHGVVETDKIVGYAIDYCSGRDLNFLRKKQTEKMFSDDIIRFYAAELVLALEYLHNQGIVYRDLKPENVMVQDNGHLMLVDFDLSTKLVAKSPETPIASSQPRPPTQTKEKKKKKKKKKRFSIFSKRRDSGISPEDSSEHVTVSMSSTSDSVEKSNSFVGTEEYVAPEIISGDGHDFSVDWWCLGVMLYEMLYGETPFRGANRKETFYRILTKVPDLTGEATPLRDLIGELLEKDPKKRICVEEIKGHEFFSGVDWKRITEIPRPPFIPELTDVTRMEGHKDIDVEGYVQEVFKVGEGNKVESNNKSKNYEENRNNNKDGWVVNHPTRIENDKFLIF